MIVLPFFSPELSHSSYLVGGTTQCAIIDPALQLRHRHDELKKQVPTAVTCSTGNRSSLAVSLLKSRGHENLLNIAGGMKGYQAAGYIKECATYLAPHGPQRF